MNHSKARLESPGGALGTRLREERKRLRLTQAQIAAAVGISAPTQVGYELGARTPDAHYLTKIERLGVDERYIRTGIREGHHAIQSLDWERLAEIRRVVAGWVRDMEVGLDIGQLVEVERLIYELTLDDPASTRQTVERVLRLVVSRE